MQASASKVPSKQRGGRWRTQTTSLRCARHLGRHRVLMFSMKKRTEFLTFCVEFLMNLSQLRPVIGKFTTSITCYALIALLELARHTCAAWGLYRLVMSKDTAAIFVSVMRGYGIFFCLTMRDMKDYISGNGPMLVNEMPHCVHSVRPQPPCQFSLL